MSDVIRKIFEDVLTSGQAVIDWVEAEKGESETLEYKENPDLVKDSEKLSRQLAKEATAFANAEGGIIIWGVEQKNKDNAPTLQVLKDPKVLHHKLSQLTNEVASPPIIGLAHKPLLLEGGGGFVATYVPQSDDRPHMALAGESRYFVRSGESAMKMGHHQVRDAFLAKREPTVEIYRTKIKPHYSDPDRFVVGLILKNAGVITLNDPFVTIDSYLRHNGTYTDWQVADEPINAPNYYEVCDRFSLRLTETNSVHPGRLLKLCSLGGKFGDLDKFYKAEISVTISGLDFWEQFRCQIDLEEIRAANTGERINRSSQDSQGFYGADFLRGIQLSKVDSGSKFVH